VVEVYDHPEPPTWHSEVRAIEAFAARARVSIAEVWNFDRADDHVDVIKQPAPSALCEM
jgi:hypothetical protein